jgi:APA family basic amino acid/polyamine antiporter
MPEPAESDRRLTRTLGLAGAVAIGLSASLGTGAFAGLALSVGRVPTIWPLAILGAALLALASGLSAGRLAAAHPTSGGTYEQASRLLAPSVGRFAGWLFLIAKSASVAAACHAMAGGLLGAAGVEDPLLRRLGATSIALLATFVVAGGLERSLASILLLLAITLASLVAFVAGIAPRDLPSPSPAPSDWLGLPQAIALAFVAFAGFGRVATLGEEVRDPSRTIPAAIAISVLTVAGATVSIFAAALSATTPAELVAILARTESPLVAIADAGGQRSLAWFLAVGGLAAMGGVVLNLLLGMSRVALAMGRRGDLPAGLAKVSRGSPRRAAIAVGLAAAVAATIGDLGSAWTISTAAILPYYAITNLSAIRESRSAAWGRPVAIAGLLGTIAVACFLPPWGLVAGVGCGLAGALISAAWLDRRPTG